LPVFLLAHDSFERSCEPCFGVSPCNLNRDSAASCVDQIHWIFRGMASLAEKEAFVTGHSAVTYWEIFFIPRVFTVAWVLYARGIHLHKTFLSCFTRQAGISLPVTDECYLFCAFRRIAGAFAARWCIIFGGWRADISKTVTSLLLVRPSCVNQHQRQRTSAQPASPACDRWSGSAVVYKPATEAKFVHG
jgi:hypothetical protein